MPASTTQTAQAIAGKCDSRIPSLVADLTSSQAASRERARKALIAIGKPAVPSLIRLLSHRNPHTRWEAAKSLCGIADPIAASALVNALDDSDQDVRWVAAEGLASLGRDALPPLLAALLERSDSGWLCEGAHHVCRALARKKGLGPIVRPLLAALERPEPGVAAPHAAYVALTKLRQSP